MIFKDLCQPSQFLTHIRNHLKKHDTVKCPFKDCELKTNVLSTFSSHITRKHKSQGFQDFSSSVTLQRDDLESNEELWSEETGDPIPNQQSNVTDSTLSLTPSRPETSPYSEPVDYTRLECKLASLILYMQQFCMFQKVQLRRY